MFFLLGIFLFKLTRFAHKMPTYALPLATASAGTSLSNAAPMVRSFLCGAVAHIACRPFLRGKVVIVLRNGGLGHGRAELGSVTQILGEGVIGQQAQPVGIPAAHVDVAGVVPTSGRVLEVVHGTDRKSAAGHLDVIRKHRAGQETGGGMRPAGLDRARSW